MPTKVHVYRNLWLRRAVVFQATGTCTRFLVRTNPGTSCQA